MKSDSAYYTHTVNHGHTIDDAEAQTHDAKRVTLVYQLKVTNLRAEKSAGRVFWSQFVAETRVFTENSAHGQSRA